MIMANASGGVLTVPRQSRARHVARDRDDVIGAIIRARGGVGRDHVRVLFEHDSGGRRADGTANEDDGYPREDYGDDDEDDYYDAKKIGYDLVTNTSGPWPKMGVRKESVTNDGMHVDREVDIYDDDDADQKGDAERYRYDNPPFKKGDFDYGLDNNSYPTQFVHDNKSYPARIGQANKHSIRANDSHKYNSGQYKSMHLLENSQRTGPLGRIPNSERTRYHGQTGSTAEIRNTKRTRYHGQTGTKIRELALTLNQVYNNNNNNNKSVRTSTGHVRKVDTSPGNFGYRKDGVSYPSDANLLNRDHIETQIPLQTGDVTSWLLQEPPATQIQTPELPWQPGEVRSQGGIPLIVDKIFWSQEVENLVPSEVDYVEPKTRAVADDRPVISGWCIICTSFSVPNVEGRSPFRDLFPTSAVLDEERAPDN
ncbi:hypothetical protein LSH36_304g07016 [Paralvinella palmiformis]|uniref:Uncharacterized protein n=1 Tax=Paralvinella palmiformis TaxID=53620 RepID=A0AAD9N333_9ANNE|nr:hypothetical protein LSH36_304g07016 [Paralvinella palmiformis]